MAVLQALNERGLTVVLVTHEADIGQYARRQIIFRDGRIVGDETVPAPRSARAELSAVMAARTGDGRRMVTTAEDEV
jgi:putative ABC transport system ATP-binding protein